MHIVIGITHTESGYKNYSLWIKQDDTTIEIIQLNPESLDELEKCDGILLSGGIDIHPWFYKSETLNYSNAPGEFNENRDRFEWKVFEFAIEKELPVLAICRGMQLVNVALGGDLIQDIEDSGKEDHRRKGETDHLHEVTVSEDSLLYEITGNEKGVINSAHHQALGTIAPELVVTAYSPDGIAEAAEWKNKSGKPFLLCVQWHPERLAFLQPGSPFSNNIREKFLEAIKNKKSTI